MSYLDEEVDEGRVSVLPDQRIWRGKVATDAADLSDLISVTIPALDPSLRWEDCMWMARDDTILPSRGDTCVIALLDTGEAFVIAWWPYG